MKIFIITGLFCIVIIACKKVNVVGQQKLSGRWELRQESGGIAGTVNYQAGNGQLYVFDNMDAYQILDSAKILRTGTYEINQSANAGDWILKLEYLSNSVSVTQTDSIRFSSNQLIFLPTASCCDMPATTYEKLQ